MTPNLFRKSHRLGIRESDNFGENTDPRNILLGYTQWGERSIRIMWIGFEPFCSNSPFVVNEGFGHCAKHEGGIMHSMYKGFLDCFMMNIDGDSTGRNFWVTCLSYAELGNLPIEESKQLNLQFLKTPD